MSTPAGATEGKRRQRDARATRQALLDAAVELFDELGYDATTVREIGERAGVDPALIARYFGGKEPLYLATLSEPKRVALPTEPIEALAAMLNKTDRRGAGPVPLAMVSPSLSDALRDEVSAAVRRRVIARLSTGFADRGASDPELRAEIVFALFLGISLTRARGTLPRLSEATVDELVTVLEPLVDALAAG